MADELVQISPQTWIFPQSAEPDRVEPNIGIICSAQHTVLVDAGNSPNHARRILYALEARSLPPVSHLIYTHHHWDHVFGGHLFDGATVVAHQLCYEQLAKSARLPWSNNFLQEEALKEPAQAGHYAAIGRAVDDWRGFQISVPQLHFSDGVRLFIDDLTLDLRHTGGKHAPDSIVVCCRSEGVLFLGDCYYPAPMGLGDNTLDHNMLEALLDDSIDTYIDGHSPPATRAEIQDYLGKAR